MSIGLASGLMYAQAPRSPQLLAHCVAVVSEIGEQDLIERLRREFAKMKAERDILKKSSGLLRGGLHFQVALRCEVPGDLASIVDLRGRVPVGGVARRGGADRPRALP